MISECSPCRARALALGDLTMPILRRNSKGAAVSDLQRRLVAKLGKDWESLMKDGDGFFGARTEAAVIAYQKRENLGADGVVGANTWSALLGATIVPPTAVTATDAAGVPLPTESVKTGTPLFLALGAAGVLIVLGLSLRAKRAAMAGYGRRKRR